MLNKLNTMAVEGRRRKSGELAKGRMGKPRLGAEGQRFPGP